MPRIFDISPTGQSHGGVFAFDEGNGRVVDAWTGNNEIPGFGKDCGVFLEIQRLDHQWNPVANVDTVVEFLKAGTTTYSNQQSGETRPNFHPGLAANREDPRPEIGNECDLGDGVDVRGNCLISQSGKGPDAKGKLSTFTNSALEAGVKDFVFKFAFAPDLIGLEAHFTQFMMPKVANSTAKRDPTCLIIGQGGKPAGGAANVHKYPNSMSGAAPTASAPVSTSAPGPVAVPSVSVAGKVNGAPAAPSTLTAELVEATVTAKLVDIATKTPKAFKIAKIKSMVDARLGGKEAGEYGESRVAEFNQLVTAVRGQMENEAFLKQIAVDYDWTVTGSGAELVIDFKPTA